MIPGGLFMCAFDRGFARRDRKGSEQLAEGQFGAGCAVHMKSVDFDNAFDGSVRPCAAPVSEWRKPSPRRDDHCFLAVNTRERDDVIAMWAGDLQRQITAVPEHIGMSVAQCQ
ncbi:hypothetical protein BN961_02433 [Afipia felis]|uniref:Uncharacterized protein n=1 Tax=Afipia felis TaxID=1035 RepID=A0A090MS19_AFIFE|nr:hypothetical protein BN961_02433 [Afipia felis]